MNDREETPPTDDGPGEKTPPEQPPYDVEPEPEAKRAQTHASSGQKGAIEAQTLLSDFDEDADFDHDPEVREALSGGKKKRQKAKAPEVEETPALVRPGMGPWRVWVAVGIVEIIVAMVLAAIYGPNHPVARALLVAYNGLMHTGTGVAAVLVCAMVLERKFGSIELAAARMVAALGAFLLIFHAPIDFLTTAKLEEWILGAIAYVAVLALTFGFSRTALMVVTGAHFGLWIVVELGMQLSRWTATAPSGTPGA